MPESTEKKIVWAVEKRDHHEGRKHLPGSIFSNLNLFDAQAEGATAVAIVRGHPKAKACAVHYRKMGAEVIFFDPAPPPPKVEAPEDEEFGDWLLKSEMGKPSLSEGKPKEKKA